MRSGTGGTGKTGREGRKGRLLRGVMLITGMLMVCLLGIYVHFYGFRLSRAFSASEVTALAREREGTLTAVAKDGVPGMVLIPAGTFRMGSTDADSMADSDEKPQHEVYLEAYYIDLYEVTNGAYAECVQAGVCTPPHNFSSFTHDSYYDNPLYRDYPVILVDWGQARAYCQWRGGDLPSEAQWEKAARGTDGRIYPWGNKFDCRKGNFDDEREYDNYVVPGGPNCDGYADTAPVGSYPEGRSPYGLYDMAGNVWEWVLDWYLDTYYSSRSTWENPFGPASGEYGVLRGGSWGYFIGDLRAANRYRYLPTYRHISVGFRCARSR